MKQLEYGTHGTPQRQPIPIATQIRNSEGGYVYEYPTVGFDTSTPNILAEFALGGI